MRLNCLLNQSHRSAQLIINECVSRMGNQLRQQGFTPEAWREAVLDVKHFLVSDK